jgi:hypothetical protein
LRRLEVVPKIAPEGGVVHEVRRRQLLRPKETALEMALERYGSPIPLALDRVKLV